MSSTTNSGGDKETRPINAYVDFLIKEDANAQFPVGGIVTYLGHDELVDSTGLLLCKGQEVSQSIHPNFTDKNGLARAPDYSGYFLRGMCSDTGKNPNNGLDPDRDSRSPMFPGGQGGASLGSIQGYATASPMNPFKIHYTTSDQAQGATHGSLQEARVSAFNESGVPVNVTSRGGDKETAPCNLAVDFYLAAVSNIEWDAIGAAILFCGNGPSFPDPKKWLKCDGRALSKKDYSALWGAIGFSEIDTGDTFFLPDARGLFLRGRDHVGGRDSASSTRYVMRNNQKKEVGNRNGSIEDSMTAIPRSKGISAQAPYVPHEYRWKDSHGKHKDDEALKWIKSSAPFSVGAGGDGESRPTNVAMDLYVKFA